MAIAVNGYASPLQPNDGVRRNSLLSPSMNRLADRCRRGQVICFQFQAETGETWCATWCGAAMQFPPLLKLAYRASVALAVHLRLGLRNALWWNHEAC